MNTKKSTFARMMDTAVENMIPEDIDRDYFARGMITKIVPHPDSTELNYINVLTKTNSYDRIVTNLESLHIGQEVTIALPGATLASGQKIEVMKIKGFHSYGCIVNEEDIPLTETKNDFRKWAKIPSFNNSIGSLYEAAKWDIVPKQINYLIKVKFHGTNAAVVVKPDGTVLAQSRKRTLTLDKDNSGFALWVEKNKDYFSQFKAKNNFYIYGEWIGQGIQKGVACCQIPNKTFAVFSLVWENNLIFIPDDIAEVLQSTLKDLYVIPIFDQILRLNLESKDTLAEAARGLNSLVAAIAEEDPVIKQQFDISGPGEGVVLYPVNLNHVEHNLLKVVTENLQSRKSAKPAVVELKNASGIREFVELTVTEARLNQGLTEVCGNEPPTKKDIGAFVKWMGKDILAEEKDHLVAANLEWKPVSAAISAKASKWLLNKIN